MQSSLLRYQTIYHEQIFENMSTTPKLVSQQPEPNHRDRKPTTSAALAAPEPEPEPTPVTLCNRCDDRVNTPIKGLTPGYCLSCFENEVYDVGRWTTKKTTKQCGLLTVNTTVTYHVHPVIHKKIGSDGAITAVWVERRKTRIKTHRTYTGPLVVGEQTTTYTPHGGFKRKSNWIGTCSNCNDCIRHPMSGKQARRPANERLCINCAKERHAKVLCSVDNSLRERAMVAAEQKTELKTNSPMVECELTPNMLYFIKHSVGFCPKCQKVVKLTKKQIIQQQKAVINGTYSDLKHTCGRCNYLAKPCDTTLFYPQPPTR